MLWGGAAGGLELRQSGGGETRLSGKFPYGRAVEMIPAGRSGQARREVIAPRAFAARIERAEEDIHLLAGHDFERPLASRAAGTLTLRDGDDALEFEAVIPAAMREAGYVRDLLAGLAAGLIRGLSPGFRVPDTAGAELVTEDADGLLRTVRSADLFEISAVTRPAYSSAQIEARSWSAAAPARPGVSHLNRWRL